MKIKLPMDHPWRIKVLSLSANVAKKEINKGKNKVSQGKYFSCLQESNKNISRVERRKFRKNLIRSQFRHDPIEDKLSARGYNWATLFLGDINTGTWASRLGESQMRQ
jgi:hypothetical protein